MGTKIAYELRADYQGTVPQEIDGEERQVPVFTGGIIAAGDRDVDVAELLEKGSGTIVVDESDNALVIALDEYPALKRVHAEPDAEAVNPYLAQTKKQLLEEAHRRDLEVPSGMTKPVLAEALLAHDEELAAGNQDVAASPDNRVQVTEAGGVEPADPAPSDTVPPSESAQA